MSQLRYRPGLGEQRTWSAGLLAVPSLTPLPATQRLRPVTRGFIMRVLPLLASSAAALAVAGCAATSVTSTPSANSPASAAPATAKAQAHVGDTIVLAGNSPGEKMAVTLVKVYPHEAPGEFETPDPDDKYASVQLRLRNTGTAAFSDSVSNEVKVIEGKGQSYEATIATGVGCTQFPGTETIAPGQSGLGCVVFQIPDSARIAEVQVALDSGFASQTGEWNASR